MIFNVSQSFLSLNSAGQRQVWRSCLQLNTLCCHPSIYCQNLACHAGAICRRQNAGALCGRCEPLRLPVSRIPHETREDAFEESIRASEGKAPFYTSQYWLLHSTDWIWKAVVWCSYGLHGIQPSSRDAHTRCVRARIPEDVMVPATLQLQFWKALMQCWLMHFALNWTTSIMRHIIRRLCSWLLPCVLSINDPFKFIRVIK